MDRMRSGRGGFGRLLIMGKKLRPKHSAVYRGLCDLHMQFFVKLRFEKQLREYHGLCDLHG